MLMLEHITHQCKGSHTRQMHDSKEPLIPQRREFIGL